MSKQIAMSILGSLAVSIGGFFASCGSSNQQSSPVVVAIPEGCFLISPKEHLELGTPVVQVKPGPNKFVFDCGRGEVAVTKNVAANQRAISFATEDLTK
jgi:hypothetical protein